ncbi:MAG: NUDIX domain-containing protein [Caulobacterales bacterium]
MPQTVPRRPLLPSRALTPLIRAWWRVSRGMTLGARGIATDQEGRVLLVRHGYQNGWHLPGGGVEHGETALAALEREMAEEGGVEVDEAILLGIFANHAIFPNDHVAVYRVTGWRPCTPRSGTEIAERGFFAPDALPDDATPGTRRRIAEAFHGAPPAPTW